MPDGFGDGMDLSVLGRWPDKYHECVDGVAAVARLCKVLGMNKKETLRVVGRKANQDNFWWLENVWNEGA